MNTVVKSRDVRTDCFWVKSSSNRTALKFSSFKSSSSLSKKSPFIRPILLDTKQYTSLDIYYIADSKKLDILLINGVIILLKYIYSQITTLVTLQRN
jgi:hypothetical protein